MSQGWENSLTQVIFLGPESRGDQGAAASGPGARPTVLILSWSSEQNVFKSMRVQGV